MRITRALLHKLARDNAEKIVRRNRELVCIYLTGSLLEAEPLLGGTTDIDLIVVHNSQPAYPREMVHLSDEVHLDIAHLSIDSFRQPRSLRTDPWLGSFLNANPTLLHDTQHWFEFTQASAGAQFDQPENVIENFRVVRILLEPHQLVIDRVETLVGFGQKFPQQIVHVTCLLAMEAS